MKLQCVLKPYNSPFTKGEYYSISHIAEYFEMNAESVQDTAKKFDYITLQDHEFAVCDE